jgi:endonuclease/exonuclease/phosphatase family metal-dependent hydrolase
MKRFLFLLTFAAALCGACAWAQDENGQITFCSYNLKNYLRMERFVGGKRTEGVGKSEKEIAAVVKFIADIHPDVLGVCEIGAEDELKDLQSRLKAAGLELPELEAAHGGDPTRQLGLLSRFPIVARDSQTELRYRIGDQIFPVQRGFLDTTVRVRKGYELRCVGVHLKSKREIPEVDQKLMRRNEAHLLRQHTESILKEKPDTRLLVYGDFNEDKAEASIVEIEGVSGMELSMHRINLKDSHGEAWTHYWEFQDLYSRFDYFFVSRPLEPYVDKRGSHIYDVPNFYSGSDHRPIVMNIDMAKNKK